MHCNPCHFLIILILASLNGICIAGIYWTSAYAHKHSDVVSALFALLLLLLECVLLSGLFYYLYRSFCRGQLQPSTSTSA